MSYDNKTKDVHVAATSTVCRKLRKFVGRGSGMSNQPLSKIVLYPLQVLLAEGGVNYWPCSKSEGQ